MKKFIDAVSSYLKEELEDSDVSPVTASDEDPLVGTDQDNPPYEDENSPLKSELEIKGLKELESADQEEVKRFINDVNDSISDLSRAEHSLNDLYDKLIELKVIDNKESLGRNITSINSKIGAFVPILRSIPKEIKLKNISKSDEKQPEVNKEEA